MKKIIGIGNALTDILIQIKNDNILSDLGLKKGSMQLVDVKKMREISEKLAALPQKMVTGGSAANTMNGIAKLGGQSGFLGKIGKDAVGQFFVDDIVANGVATHLIPSETPSGRCIVLISPDGERTMCTFLGAAAELSAADISPEIFANYDIFHIEGYLVQNQDLIQSAVEIAKKIGLLISIDMASFNVVEENLDFFKNLVRNNVNLVFANEEEVRAFTGEQPEKALDVIVEMADIAVVKLGKNGSLIKSDKQTYKINAIDALSIDTTGAGDLYAAGFLFGISKHYELARCGEIGTLVSGKTVEVIGAKLDENIWQEIKKSI
jgi:sugar/nucleoside kinase (ribokinase family)